MRSQTGPREILNRRTIDRQGESGPLPDDWSGVVSASRLTAVGRGRYYNRDPPVGRQLLPGNDRKPAPFRWPRPTRRGFVWLCAALTAVLVSVIFPVATTAQLPCPDLTWVAVPTAGGIHSLFDIHGISGMSAILLMFVHAVWATIVSIRKDEKMILKFHKISVIVWAIWLIPYFSPMVFHLA